MFCPKCGLDLNGLAYCPRCNSATQGNEESGSGAINVGVQGCYGSGVAKNEHEGYAIGALICGIFSFFGGGLITGIIAWVLGNKYRDSGEISKLQMANAGKIMGIITVVLCGLAALIGIVAFVLSFWMALDVVSSVPSAYLY